MPASAISAVACAAVGFRARANSVSQSFQAALSRGRAAKRNRTRDPAQRLAAKRRITRTVARDSVLRSFAALGPGSPSTALRSVAGVRERAVGTLRHPGRTRFAGRPIVGVRQRQIAPV